LVEDLDALLSIVEGKILDVVDCVDSEVFNIGAVGG